MQYFLNKNLFFVLPLYQRHRNLFTCIYVFIVVLYQIKWKSKSQISVVYERLAVPRLL